MWARITVESGDDARLEFEVGSEEACYPDAVSECVAGVLRLYATVMTEG